MATQGVDLSERASGNSTSSNKEVKKPDWDGRRRIIIWCHRKAGDSCNERAKEIMANLKTKGDVDKLWRPTDYFLSEDECLTETFNEMIKLWDNKQLNQQLKPRLLKTEGLSVTRLQSDLQTHLSRINRTIETIMVMTTSDKMTFQNVVKSLSDETVVLNKPPFVALLESRGEGSRWTTDPTLQKFDWNYVILPGSQTPESSPRSEHSLVENTQDFVRASIDDISEIFRRHHTTK
ncbi:unnamed protein product [Calypogeia fissa]